MQGVRLIENECIVDKRYEIFLADDLNYNLWGKQDLNYEV